MNDKIVKYLLVGLAILSISCSENSKKSFFFIQLCDPQIGMSEYEHDLRKLKQALKQINESNVDFVVSCGDFVQDANDSSNSDFKNVMEGLNVPCYFVPGNHDMGNIPNDSTLAYYRYNFGKDYFDFFNKGYSFIVTNSQLWKNNLGTESDKHDSWFRESLKDKKKKDIPVFVIGHYPLFTEEPMEDEHYFNFPQIKRSELLELFYKNNVVAYLSGHSHKLIVNNYKGIQLISGETTSKNFDDRPFGFRIWSVSQDTVKHEFVPLNFSKAKEENIDHFINK